MRVFLPRQNVLRTQSAVQSAFLVVFYPYTLFTSHKYVCSRGREPPNHEQQLCSCRNRVEIVSGTARFTSGTPAITVRTRKIISRTHKVFPIILESLKTTELARGAQNYP